MLNPAFPAQFESSDYILNKDLSDKVANKNSNFDTVEDRFDDVYTFEIWKKLNHFGISPENLNSLEVLDICAGSGFLSYHLLKKSSPKRFTLLDISQKEINHARKILSDKYPDMLIEYAVVDFLNSDYQIQYDLIIGNSFLHHFYNLPEALLKIKSMLKPGGIFIDLHEPIIASCALESRNPLALLKHIIYGKKYIELFRKKYSVSPYDGFNEDVWIFTANDISRLLNNAGFVNFKLKNWHLFRSMVVAYSSFFPNHKPLSIKLLKAAVNLDEFVSGFLPERFFGSVSIFAKKSNN